VREALGADLPTLQRLAADEQKVRRQVLHHVEQAARVRAARFELQHYHLAHTLRVLPAVRDARERRAREERVAGVQVRLGRPWTPAERLMARHLLEKKTVEQTHAILRRLPVRAAKGVNP